MHRGADSADHDDPPDDEDDTELRGRVAEARPALDPIQAAVLRANASAGLFGARVPVRVGRYELVREVGTGGSARCSSRAIPSSTVTSRSS